MKQFQKLRFLSSTIHNFKGWIMNIAVWWLHDIGGLIGKLSVLYVITRKYLFLAAVGKDTYALFKTFYVFLVFLMVNVFLWLWCILGTVFSEISVSKGESISWDLWVYETVFSFALMGDSIAWNCFWELCILYICGRM